MASSALGKRKRDSKHPYVRINLLHPNARADKIRSYLTGNFAPQQETVSLTPCSYEGRIPPEFLGGQYVRNGSNPVTNEDLGRDAHWFDGDGMLSGVCFTRDWSSPEGVRPEFVSQFILTDLFLSSITTPSLKRPILPSIATLANPLSRLLKLCCVILRTIFLVVLSRLPGSERTIKKISVANTSVLYHDGRALATCESGPPIRIQLPSLETVGWYNGRRAEGEPEAEGERHEERKDVLGGEGVLSFMREWTTAHPKVDIRTGEMLMFHCTPLPPFVHYTIIPPKGASTTAARMNIPLPGVSSAKMMHDFGVSREHTIIMDLPLSLDALQLAKGRPIISYDSSIPSRFGIFPRAKPQDMRWFETIACCIFHTANAWDVYDSRDKLQSVDLLACRLTSAAMLYTAGNIAGPRPTERTALNVRRAQRARHWSFEKSPSLESAASETHEETPLLPAISQTEDIPAADEEVDQCRLYYYSFDMQSHPKSENIAHQFALSALPFEFPSTHPALSMSKATYVYGCSSTITSFNPALGRTARIDCLVKFNATSLIERGKSKPPGITGCVDGRTIQEILADQSASDGSGEGAIQIFKCPGLVFAQEPRFVPCENAETEDDGYLVFYTFDEQQIDEESGEVVAGAKSELWIIDARDMRTVVAKVKLPTRVPHGLHGNWFSEAEVRDQRAVESFRRRPEPRALRLRDKMGKRVIGAAVWAMGG